MMVPWDGNGGPPECIPLDSFAPFQDAVRRARAVSASSGHRRDTCQRTRAAFSAERAETSLSSRTWHCATSTDHRNLARQSKSPQSSSITGQPSSARHTKFGLRSSARHLPRSQPQRAYWPSPFNSSPTTISHPLPVFSTSSLTPRAMSDLCPVYAPFFGAMVSASPPHVGQGIWLTTRRCCPFDALS